MSERRRSYQSTFSEFDQHVVKFQESLKPQPMPSVAVKRRGEWVLMPVTHSQFQRMGAQV